MATSVAAVRRNALELLWKFAKARKRGAAFGGEPTICPEGLCPPERFFNRDPDLGFCDHVVVAPATLVIEILSRTDPIRKVLKRVTQFLADGTPLVWIIDPEDQILTALQAGKRSKDFNIDDEVTGEEVLPDLRVKVADFFTMPGE